jgi:hypothetical protein
LQIHCQLARTGTENADQMQIQPSHLAGRDSLRSRWIPSSAMTSEPSTPTEFVTVLLEADGVLLVTDPASSRASCVTARHPRADQLGRHAGRASCPTCGP